MHREVILGSSNLPDDGEYHENADNNHDGHDNLLFELFVHAGVPVDFLYSGVWRLHVQEASA